jgi:hypothetical protein
MAWQITDEYIDLIRSRHVVIFKNPEYGPEHPGHHLIHDFRLNVCPHCGTPHQNAIGEPVDFEKVKTETLAALHAHHRVAMQKKEANPRVRIGTKPK